MLVLKFNPFHDDKTGRFTSRDGVNRKNFHRYMNHQARWMESMAKVHGYQSLDEFVKQNPTKFNDLATIWRNRYATIPSQQDRTKSKGPGILDLIGNMGSDLMDFLQKQESSSALDRFAIRKFNQFHDDKTGRFTTAAGAQRPFDNNKYSALDKKLIDYKVDRPLNDPTKVIHIAKIVRGAKVMVPYSSVPFFDQLNEMQGTPNPEHMDAKTYSKAREKLFEDQPVEKVQIKDLTFTQDVVNRSKVYENVREKKSKAGYVVRYGGADYLMDGHHSAMSRSLRGKSKMKAHVLVIKKSKKGDLSCAFFSPVSF